MNTVAGSILTTHRHVTSSTVSSSSVSFSFLFFILLSFFLLDISKRYMCPTRTMRPDLFSFDFIRAILLIVLNFLLYFSTPSAYDYTIGLACGFFIVDVFIYISLV